MHSAKTRPRPSAAVWIFVVRPPRDFPMPCRARLDSKSSLLFGLRPRAGGPDDGGIDLRVPVRVALGVGIALHDLRSLPQVPSSSQRANRY
jgi:hypothetical protein